MDRDTFRHWHKPGDEPSELKVPALCCASEFRRLLETIEREHYADQGRAVNDERKRVILTAVEVLETFGENVAVALTGREKELAQTLTRHAVEAVRKTGCICPRLDAQRLGEPSGRTILGRDYRCGMHEIGAER